MREPSGAAAAPAREAQVAHEAARTDAARTDAAPLIGWDIGGAHVKACLLQDGVVADVAQWPCTLWLGLAHLDRVLDDAGSHWPAAWGAARHAATMTGEMADLFADRRDGVRQLAGRLRARLGGSLRLYAGASGWAGAAEADRHWEAIASANWRATAEWVARGPGAAVLVDVGSTTTDLIPVRDGRVAARGRTDAERLATGELVYQGVVRTPLCALARHVPFGGARTGVMNEVFATTSDVYRLTGELDAHHDQHATADGAPRDAGSTRRRLARMIGRDAHEAGAAQWVALAHAWRGAQLDQIGEELDRVCGAAGLAADAAVIGAGCGDFLAAELAARTGRPYRRFVDTLPRRAGGAGAGDDAASRWAQVCAPAVAVALLAAQG